MFIVTKNRYRFLIFLFFMTIKSFGINFPILERLDSNIIQYRSESYMNGWSCGFFVLNNAQKIQQIITGKKIKSMSTCMPVLKEKSIDPSQGTSLLLRADLNEKVFQLPHLYSLCFINEEVIFGSSNVCSSVHFSSNNDDNFFMKSIFNKEIVKSANDYQREESSKQLQKIHAILDNVDRTGKPVVLHFDCGLSPVEAHCILVSLVKKPGENICISIMDNMNISMTKNRFRKKIIDTFKNNFGF